MTETKLYPCRSLKILVLVVRQSDQLREDIRDYQRQLESQRESLLMRRGEDVEARDKITQRNKDLINALDENRVSGKPGGSLLLRVLQKTI